MYTSTQWYAHAYDTRMCIKNNFFESNKGRKKKAKRNQDIDLNSRRTEMEPLAKDEAWDSNLSDKESPWAEPYLRTAKDQVGMQVYCNLKWQNHLLVAPCQVQNPDEWFYHMVTLTSTNDNTYHSTNHLSTIRNQIYADASV